MLVVVVDVKNNVCFKYNLAIVSPQGGKDMQNNDDFFAKLVKSLGFIAARAIIMEQLKRLDALSLIRLMRESRLLRGLVGEGADIWGSHLTQLQDNINHDGRNIKPMLWCFDDNNPGIFFSTVYIELFPTMYRVFLFQWSGYPHVWIDRKTKQVLQVQDWSLSVVSRDTEADKLWFRHLLVDIYNYYALNSDQTPAHLSLVAVRKPDPRSLFGLRWIEPDSSIWESNRRYSRTCERLEHLLRNPISRKLSLLAVPGQWIRLSYDKKDVSISDTRYASKNVSESPPDLTLFGVWVPCLTQPKTTWVLFSFRNGRFVREEDEAARDSRPPIVRSNIIIYEGSFLAPRELPCPDEWNISSSFETTLFYEAKTGAILCLRIDTGDFVHVNNFVHPNQTEHQLSYSVPYKRVFRFTLLQTLRHTTDGDPTIDAPITIGLCDACRLKPITAQCGNGCGSAFYCGQECADAHISKHECK